MNLRRERDFTTAMYAPQVPYYSVQEVPTEPFGSFHTFPSLPNHVDTHLDEGHYYDNQQKYYFVQEGQFEPFHGYGQSQEIVYVVQEEPPMTDQEAKQYGLYANILGQYVTNKGKNAAKLQSEIDYLKKLRNKFPIAKDFINMQIQKKRALKKELTKQAGQQDIRDKGYTAIVLGGSFLVAALGIFVVTKIIKK